jgi:hypothetical protein
MEIVFLSLWKISNYRRSLMRENFPNGLSTLAVKAIVGAIFESKTTHFLVMLVGTRSTLLSRKMKCFVGQFFLRCFSTCLHLVPFGSLASNTKMITSELSKTLYSSTQILLLYPALILLSLFSFLISRSLLLLRLRSFSGS